MRTAYKLITDKEPPPYALTPRRCSWYGRALKRPTVQLGDDVTLSVAVVHGGKIHVDFLNALKDSDKHYDFIEVMAHLGGCIGGGGQPRTKLPQAVKTGVENSYGRPLYEADANYKMGLLLMKTPEVQAFIQRLLG